MKTDTKQLIELVGIVGVIASLIFVGMQLILDRRVATGNQYQARTEMIIGLRQSRFENEGYVRDRAARLDLVKPAWWTDEFEEMRQNFGMDNEAVVRLDISCNSQGFIFDNLYFQYRQGLLDRNRWQEIRESIKPFLTNVCRTFFINGWQYNSEMRSLIDELRQEIEAENAV